MNACYEEVGTVDLRGCTLEGLTFRDTGGTNGWLADPLPEWLPDFLRRLPIEGRILRVDVRKLPAGQGIPPHVDPFVHPSRLVVEHRYQVPIVTHPAVTMRWPEDGVEVHLQAGHVYEVDFTRLHAIVQQAPIDRVHVQVHTASLARPR